MAVYQLARFRVRADAHLDAERAMHELATFVRNELPGSSWTAYRDPGASAHYSVFIRADDQRALALHHERASIARALGAFLVGDVEVSEWQLVTSSDLAPRHRPRRR